MTDKKCECQGHCLNDDERLAIVESKMQSVNYEEHGLVEVLIAAQETYGYLSEELMKYVAKKLHVPTSRVWGVATFYDRFKIEVAGAKECLICTGPVCSAAGAKDILSEACKQAGVSQPGQPSLDKRYLIKETTCLGLCDQGPAALVNKKPQVHLSISDVTALLKGEAQQPVIRVVGEPRVLTAPINKLSPVDIEAHREEGSFSALDKTLHEMTPEEVIGELKESRLAGRGGAGFLTGLKWQMVREAESKTKYVVCNFDEAEPGSFKDRALMEGNPLRVIEGLIICAHTVGANMGFIFIRSEYENASAIVEKAIETLYTEDLLGKDILGSDYSFDLKVVRNAGAYICGEETALFEAIEGKRGQPRIKPPYPTQSGLFGKPTVINNVETLAVIPDLVNHGGEWFRQWGTNNSVGLRLFCLSGHVENPCVVESPYGLTVREIIERFGGGFVGEPQAILIGGAAGGFIGPDSFDVRLTHEDLRPLGVPIGTGAIMVFNSTVDMWQVLEGLAHFFVHETCGQCAPCRLGTKEIHDILTGINHGKGTFADINRLDSVGQLMDETCICGLGRSAANPIRTFLRNTQTAT
ncbi:MAG: NADH-quinone oxidoreductase subunit NuoF [Anaerolineales bacterium]|jgi:NADH-quinone oxidoreductase subunit F